MKRLMKCPVAFFFAVIVLYAFSTIAPMHGMDTGVTQTITNATNQVGSNQPSVIITGSDGRDVDLVYGRLETLKKLVAIRRALDGCGQDQSIILDFKKQKAPDYVSALTLEKIADYLGGRIEPSKFKPEENIKMALTVNFLEGVAPALSFNEKRIMDNKVSELVYQAMGDLEKLSTMDLDKKVELKKLFDGCTDINKVCKGCKRIVDVNGPVSVTVPCSHNQRWHENCLVKAFKNYHILSNSSNLEAKLCSVCSNYRIDLWSGLSQSEKYDFYKNSLRERALAILPEIAAVWLAGAVYCSGTYAGSSLLIRFFGMNGVKHMLLGMFGGGFAVHYFCQPLTSDEFQMWAFLGGLVSFPAGVCWLDSKLLGLISPVLTKNPVATSLASILALLPTFVALGSGQEGYFKRCRLAHRAVREDKLNWHRGKYQGKQFKVDFSVIENPIIGGVQSALSAWLTGYFINKYLYNS